MDTLLIQVTNQNAYSLLNELEKLHLIKVLKKENKTEKLSEKYAGKLPADAAKKLHDHIKQSRGEWDM
ncbi:hypothetical protein [Mucilaginibacter ginsenosidivorans]|uniref:Uncharacterized protein n=1 Tax=Mucilaginibacter ginsenosidivorans TaxID=398053 RepID=A0A5B8V1Q8_9SPHI|nr:hypothetical protein [Mucilaginibacter ginsenosidivorans]QEC65370.1 hypothetical protein FRZ54_23280 [Mucilaginibacter ginsenosidivorans]